MSAQQICGAVISVRYSEDIIYLWNRNADNREAADKIKDTLRRILSLPHFIHLEYRRHQDSMSGTGNNDRDRSGGDTRIIRGVNDREYGGPSRNNSLNGGSSWTRGGQGVQAGAR
jgi:Eukaryotic initiation factor 4E